MKQYLWTLDGGRLQCQSAHNDSETNWLFLPGGPGLGSEVLTGLTSLLKDKIPGVIWHFDLPNDGSNYLKDKPISNWRSSIIQATTAFEKVIWVAHSTPGMYIQTMPELEGVLHGLVLIGSAPDSSWQKTFAEYCKHHVDSIILSAEKEYAENPSNESLRQLLIAAAKYCFTNKKSLLKGKELFKKIPVNHAANEWSSKHFNSENYKATWIPQKTPTLITTGSNDNITSLALFKNNKMYQRDNILIEEIAAAGHYPWFENPKEVIIAFEKFCEVFGL
ncbi:MAG: alpha/beta hydrolase [Gammaproteobacteria bacterium]|nr:alpha/beta hydrolase [Gammaproteobacteria bacterium]MCW5582761.1 alpha/beta hydrolase [Gammaproteobacteria bacterium]